MADSISAIPQQPFLGRLAEFLRFLEKDRPEFLPSQLGVMQGISKLALPQASTIENLSYGNQPFTMPPSGTGAMIPQAKTGRKAEIADLVGMITGGVPGAGAVAGVGTKLSNEAADALVRAITRNPQATAPAVLQETAMPFMQAVAPKPIGQGLIKIKQDAKNLTEKEFLDKYVTQTLPEHLESKNLPSGVKNQKPHEFLPPEMLDPSEWKNWSDRSISGAAEKVSQFQKSLVEGAQFPPVLVHTRKGEFPIVEDGHHRMAAYLAEGYKSVPVSFDIDSLIKIWKEQNNSDKKVSEIYKSYIKSLLD